MSTNTPIASQTLTSAVSSVTFTGIPQNYTDLIIISNVKYTSYSGSLALTFNSDTGSNYSTIYMYGQGSLAESGRQTNINNLLISRANSTVYGIGRTNIQNYSNTTTYKTVLDKADLGGGTNPLALANVGLWRNTSAITSLTITALNSDTFASGSTFNLYGIAAGSPKAFGGNTVTTDGTYWYHTFTSSGTFTPAQALTADYLVVAGGGGGGSNHGAGGGAGGLRSTVTATGGGGALESAVSLTAQAYTVTVGAGGTAGSGTGGTLGGNGSNSVFATITSTGGGGGAGYPAFPNGSTGGSGGGGASTDAGGNGTGGAGTANQGYAGGAGGGTNISGGGGGGASSVGAAASSSGTGGSGGNGVTNSITGSSVTYAGGGGGGGWSRQGFYSPGSGGTGGGGAGAPSGVATTGVSGSTNTGGAGGGGGDANASGGAGGSGIVIVRYAV